MLLYACGTNLRQHVESALKVCGGVVNQRDSEGHPQLHQRDVVTGPLGELERSLDVAQRGIVGQKHSSRYRGRVLEPENGSVDSGSASWANSTAQSKSSRHRLLPVVHLATPRNICAPGQRRSEDKGAEGGITACNVDYGLRPSQRVGQLTSFDLDYDRE